ncbi:Glutamate synthase subunit alpha [Aphelenchoides bicaudatus]|nr:Glutamate synthase subunit alpha [Aphelenchoides bicaudatus]
MEDMELILSPMVDDAKEAIGSMGDDTPLAVISDKPRHPGHQPADRSPTRTACDEPEDAFRATSPTSSMKRGRATTFL